MRGGGSLPTLNGDDGGNGRVRRVISVAEIQRHLSSNRSQQRPFTPSLTTRRAMSRRLQSLLILLSVADGDLTPVRAELLRVMADQDQGLVGQQATAHLSTRSVKALPDAKQLPAGG